MKTIDTGMKANTCPVTNARSPNLSRSFEDFRISYNPSSVDYGCDTTAIVLKGRVFFILNGDHAVQLCNAATGGGMQACVEYFIDNVAHANHYSEHRMATRMIDDPFDLYSTALEIIGEDNISRVRMAWHNHTNKDPKNTALQDAQTAA